MRTTLAWFWAAALLFCSGAAQAEQRIALLIANSEYPSEVGQLGDQPGRDVDRIAAALKASGFKAEDVAVHRDLDRAGTLREIRRFEERLRRGGQDVVGFFYYAGHGASAWIGPDGGDYILPARTQITSAEHLVDENRGLSVKNLIRRLRRAMSAAPQGALFVVLDSCRNTLRSSFNRSSEQRGFTAAPNTSGLLISYAAPAGALTPNDGAFAQALADEIRKPGQSALDAFSAAGRTVAARRGGGQNALPVLAPALNRKFCFNGCTAVSGATVATTPTAQEPATRDDVAAYALATALDNPVARAAALEAFLRQHPRSGLRRAAERELREAKKAASAAAATAPAFGAASQPHTPPAAPSGFAAKLLRAGTRGLKECPDCPTVIAVPAGAFTMGGPASEGGAAAERPLQPVQIKAFALGRHEVTVAEFRRFANATGRKPSSACWGYDSAGGFGLQLGRSWAAPSFVQGANHPVICIAWRDAKAYVAWLNEQVPGAPYRLPSEAEWEYAARAGSRSAYPWGARPGDACAYSNGKDRAATGRFHPQSPGNSCNDGYAFSAPVGRFQANRFGLHDMIGNAWEWTEDCWAASHAARPRDGSAQRQGADCSAGALRGGSWVNSIGFLRSAYRGKIERNRQIDSVGFRVARTLETP